MICLKCNGTKIDFFLREECLSLKYESKGITGRAINKLINIFNQNPYTIRCSKCKAILKEVERNE